MPQEHVAAERGAKVVCSGFAEVSAESSGVCVCDGKGEGGDVQVGMVEPCKWLPSGIPRWEPGLQRAVPGSAETCRWLPFHLFLIRMQQTLV